MSEDKNDSQIRLEEENTRLRETLRLRDEFLALASHELRTPLTTLLLQAQLLEKSKDEAKAQERRISILRQARRLNTLLDEMIEVLRINEGTLKLTREELDLSELTRQCVEQTLPEAGAAEVTVKIRAPQAVRGHWDRKRIESVIQSFISNAYRFGRGTPVTIDVSARDGQALLSVSDEGIGIETRNQTKIFERFERAVSTRNYGDFGIELWLAKQIAVAHGGDICVTSEPGKGSRFDLSLPLQSESKVP